MKTKAQHRTNWRYYRACQTCGVPPAQPCLSLVALRSYAQRRETVQLPHAGRERAISDQTPPPAPRPECPSLNPFYGVQCGMGQHDGSTHGQYDRAMGPIFWRDADAGPVPEMGDHHA